jgi:peptidoglycan/LPS O-acetylase OafA/YrhL
MLYLDCLRLIASAGIVFLHMSAKVASGTWSDHITLSIYSLHLFVDLFFVVSGYVISFVYIKRMSNWLDYGEFIKKRLARLLPLHWAILGIYVALGFISSVYGLRPEDPIRYDFGCVVPNLLFLQATAFCPHESFNAVSWSISAEFFMYVSTPVIFFLIHRCKWWIATVVIAGSFLVVTLYSLPSMIWTDWTTPDGPIRAIPSFFLGTLLYRFRDQLARISFGIAGMVCSLIAFFAGTLLMFSPYVLLFLLYLTVSFAIAADMRGQTARIVRAAAAGGQLTYSSYMLHDLIITVFLTYLGKHILHFSGMRMNILVVVAFVAVWPISYISLMTFEHPLRRYIGQLSKARSSTPLQPNQ